MEHLVEILSCRPCCPFHGITGHRVLGDARIDGIPIKYDLIVSTKGPILKLDNKEVRRHPDYKGIRRVFWYEVQNYKAEHRGI